MTQAWQYMSAANAQQKTFVVLVASYFENVFHSL